MTLLNKSYTRIKPEDRKQIIADYVAGVRVRDTSRKLNCSEASIYSVLKQEGIARRPAGPVNGSGYSKGPIYDNPYLLARVNVCKRLHREEGYPVNELMKLMRRGRTTISDYLNRPDQDSEAQWIAVAESEVNYPPKKFSEPS